MKSGIVLQESLAPLTAYANRKAVGLSDFLRRQPNLDIAIPGNRGAQSWLLTTYLDDVSYSWPSMFVCAGPAVTQSLSKQESGNHTGVAECVVGVLPL